MRIVQSIFSTAFNGSERYCLDLALAQQALGHDVTVIATKGSEIARRAAGHVPLVALPALIRAPAFMAQVLRLRPDIVHAHLSVACRSLSWLQRMPFVSAPAAVATLHVGFKPWQHKALNGIIRLMPSQIAQMPDYRGVSDTIGNWPPAGFAFQPQRRDAIRAELGLSPDTVLFGMVGRLHPSKNVPFLLRAWKAAKLANAHLVIIGTGPDEAVVHAMAAECTNVSVLGYRNDVQDWYSAFDVFALPSSFELFALVLMEAMECGCAVIATDIPGPAEFMPVPPATLVQLNDDAELAAALENAEGQCRSRGFARVEYDMTPFRRDSQVNKILEFYQRVLQDPHLSH